MEESGSGPALLLVHGLGGPLMWQRVLGPLSADFRVISIHLPGFGESDAPDVPFRLDDHARFLLRALDELQIPRATLMGTSLGGEIAANAALIDPGRVERLILVNTTGFRRGGRLAPALLRLTLVRFLLTLLLRSRRIVCLLGGLSFHDRAARPGTLCEEVFEQLSRPGHREAYVEGMRSVVSGSGGMEGTLQLPALLIWGEFDRWARVPDTRFTGVSGRTTIVVPGAGHSLPLEKPAELCAAVRAFATRAPGALS